MDYSLIIPAWNEASFIGHTVSTMREAIRELAVDGGWQGELIVVDNNSTDATAEIAERCGARVVFEPVNQIARARNRGAAAAETGAGATGASAAGASTTGASTAGVATTGMLVFLDADTTCSVSLLRHVLQRLESGKVVGGGSTIAPDRPVSDNAMRGLRFWNSLARRGGLAAGCFVFCRRDAFEAVGGFDERVYAGEEIFLSRALKRWGRLRGMSFEIATMDPVITSVRKLDWYTPMQLMRQVLLVLTPGAIFSKRLCRTWYDDRQRDRASDDST